MIALRRVSSLSALVAIAACGGGEPEATEDSSPDAQTDTAATAVQMPETDIWLADLEVVDGQLRLGGAQNVTDRAGYENQPAFLADGSFLYTRSEGESTDIWRYDPATGENRQITRTPESEYSPTPVPGSASFSVVRVESDGTQRLWEFEADGQNPELVFADVSPVGYHAWVDGERAFLFILGDPPTLHSVRRGVAGSTLLAEGIGRSIQKVPGEAAVSFVEVTEVGTEIETWAVDDVLSELLAEGIDGGEDHAWTPDGVLLQANGNTVHAFRPDAEGWREMGSVAADVDITRLAVSPDGTRIALVAAPTEGG